jgi:hypothetical protein
LTEDGRDLEPVVMALGGWGARFLRPDLVDHVINLRYAVVSLKRRYRPVEPPRGPDSRWRVQLQGDDRTFWLLLGGETLELDTLPLGAADLRCQADDEGVFIRWLKAGAGTDDLVRAGALRLEGAEAARSALEQAFGL